MILDNFVYIFVAIFGLVASTVATEVVGESGKDDITGLGSPYFQNGEAGGRVNVTTQLGSTTYLHCRVNRLGGKMVSWLKRVGGPEDDPHLLTYGRQTYSSDARYQIFQEKPNNWKLQIQYTKRGDQGLYECQVSSRTPLIKYTYLTVVVPTIKIVDERLQEVEDQKFYDGGSTIKLKCIVENIVDEQPGYIIWKKGNRMLNYDTERGGISVRTDLLASGAVSRLHIAGANHRDSGNYTCQMGRTAQASIELQIIPGPDDDVIADFSAKLRIGFPQIDTDGDGKIRCDQLMELLLAVDPTLTEENVDGQDMIAAMADVDDDNMLTVDELINFLTASAGVEPTRAQLGAAMFKLHDTDKNGKMSLEELNAMYVVQSGGRPEHGVTDWSDGLMDWALQLMDANKDGQLSLEEYVNPQNGAINLHDF